LRMRIAQHRPALYELALVLLRRSYLTRAATEVGLLIGE
jgi:hypothetical protein